MERTTSDRAARFGLLALVGLLGVYAWHLSFGIGGPETKSFFDNGVYYAIQIGATALVLARGLLVPAERLIWLLLGIALVSTTAGDLYYTYGFSDPNNIPYPSLADALYLAFFPPCYVAIGLLVRSRIGSFGASLWLDGIVAGLATGAVASGLVFQAVLDASTGSPAAVATTLAYPLADFILLILAVGAVAASGWRFDRTWAFLIGGLLVYSVADSIYQYQANVGTYQVGTLLDVTWPLAAVLLAGAAWQPSRRSDARIEGWATFALPPAFAVISISVLVFDHYNRVNALAVYLAVGALVAVLVRLALTFRENLAMLLETRRLNRLQREYIEEVGHVVDAAGAVEAQTFEPASLDGVAVRDDALGKLARVFQRMAREVYEREQRLKAQVQELRIEIDEARAARKVEEITDTDYFRDLQKKSKELRLDSD